MIERKIPHIATILKQVRRRPSSLRGSRPSAIYRALASWPGAKNHLPVFFKIFDPRLQNKAFFNELLCNRLAKAVGLPVPDDVRLCACKKALMIGPRRFMDNRDPDSEWIAGVASVDADPKGVIQLIRSGPDRLLEAELHRWRHLAKVAVFDELILNVDRNRNNLHRIGKGQFILIDHVDAFGGPDWKLEDLEKRLKKPSAKNDVANFIAESSNEDTKAQMLIIADHFARNLEITGGFLDIDFLAFDRLYQLEDGTTQSIVDLLNRRRAILPEMLFYHLKAGQLFQ